MVYLLALLPIAIGGGLIWYGMSRSKLKQTMADMPTSPIGTLRPGQFVEIKGRATSDNPLQAPETNQDVVYYSYKVEREERRRDSEGRTRTEWRTIDSGSSQSPFVLVDDSGDVMIDPEGSELDCPKIVDRYISPADGADSGILKMLAITLGSMAERQKISVWAIGMDQRLYVLGNTTGTAEDLRVGKGADKFLISTKSEEQMAKSLGTQSMVFYAIGAILCAIGVAVMIGAAM